MKKLTLTIFVLLSLSCASTGRNPDLSINLMGLEIPYKEFLGMDKQEIIKQLIKDCNIDTQKLFIDFYYNLYEVPQQPSGIGYRVEVEWKIQKDGKKPFKFRKSYFLYFYGQWKDAAIDELNRLRSFLVQNYCKPSRSK